MASFGSGFAAGLNSGMSMGKMLMDTYNENKQKRDLEEAGTLDQKVIEGKLSDNDQKTADFVNNADNGYEVQQKEGGGLRFRTAGSENDWQELSGAKQYSLGGKSQSTEFSPEQIARARHEAIADVYTRNGDPARGLQYRQMARESRYADNEEKIMDYMRNSSNMSDDEFYGGLAKIATNHGNDGLSFGYTKGPKGEPLIGMVGTDGTMHLQPATRDLAVSKLLQYVSPKNFQQERTYGLQRDELGIKRDTLSETSRHHRAYEGILSERNGLLGGGSGGNSFKAMEQKADALTQAYMKADPGMSQESANKRAWQVLTRDTQGLKGEPEAQIEFDDGNGNKIKGTASQVHNARLKTDGTYRAANGGNGLAMAPPVDNQTGRGAPNQGKAPAKSAGVSDAELNTMISDASRGGGTGKAYLQQALASGELNINQRKRVEDALNTR